MVQFLGVTIDTLGKEIRNYHARYLAKNQAIEEKDQIDIVGDLASYLKIRNIADRIESNDAADTSLNLGHLNIDDEKAAIIANALKKNHTIKDLDRRGNQISDDGAKSFAEMLKENNTLTFINFNENMIDDDGAESIANALKFNKSLEDINFGWNYITHRGVEYFESALQRNQKLSAAVSKLENWCTQTIQNEESHKFSKEDYDELSELVKNFNFEFNLEQKTKFSEAATLIMRNIDSKDLSLKDAADNFLANLSEKDILDPNYVKREFSLAYRSIFCQYNHLFSVTCRKCDQTLLDNIDPETNNTLLMKAIRKNWFEGSKIIAERISTDLLDKEYKTALLFVDDSKFEENQKEELRKIINSRNVKPLETISELADALPSSSPNITSHKSSITTLVSKGGRE